MNTSDDSMYFYNDDLREFERLNTTTESIYELGDLNSLIILKNGKNITSFEDVENYDDILFLSQDLSEFDDLSTFYVGNYFSILSNSLSIRPLRNLKAIIALNVSLNVTSLYRMFFKLRELTTISGLETWDTGNVRNMAAMFAGCTNLKTIHGLDSLDVRNVVKMNSMFYKAFGLTNLDELSSWDVSSALEMQFMFSDCINLDTIAPIKNWKIRNDCKFESMFNGCNPLVKMEFYSIWKEQLKNSFSDIFPNIDESRITCKNCGKFNIIYDETTSSLVCRNCERVIRQFDFTCPECGNFNLVFDYRLMELYCSDCGLVIESWMNDADFF